MHPWKPPDFWRQGCNAEVLIVFSHFILSFYAVQSPTILVSQLLHLPPQLSTPASSLLLLEELAFVQRFDRPALDDLLKEHLSGKDRQPSKEVTCSRQVHLPLWHHKNPTRSPLVETLLETISRQVVGSRPNVMDSKISKTMMGRSF